MPTDTAPTVDQIGSVDRFARLIRECCHHAARHVDIDEYALGLIKGLLSGTGDDPYLIQFVRNVLAAADRVKSEQPR